MTPPRRHPSVPGLPGVHLPPVDSRPPPDAQGAEDWYAALCGVEGRILASLGDMREDVDKRLDAHAAEVAALRSQTLERDLAAQHQIAQLAATSGRIGGHEAGGAAGRLWGVAGALATVIALAVLAAMLHSWGVDVPGLVPTTTAASHP